MGRLGINLLCLNWMASIGWFRSRVDNPERGGAVKAVSPDGGIVYMLVLDGRNPSNCAFHPNGGLVVSETQNGELVKFDNDPTGAKLFKR